MRDDPSASHALFMLVFVYDLLGPLSEKRVQPDLTLVPEAVALLVGAAECMLRLAVALAQALQQLDGVERASAAAAARGRRAAASCCTVGVQAAAALVHCAAENVALGNVECTARGSAAVQHCAASLAKLARLAMAGQGQAAAVWGTEQLCAVLATVSEGLAKLAAAAPGGGDVDGWLHTEQQR